MSNGQLLGPDSKLVEPEQEILKPETSNLELLLPRTSSSLNPACHRREQARQQAAEQKRPSARPVVPTLMPSRCSWITVPISPSQHGQWSRLMGIAFHEHLDGAKLGAIVPDYWQAFQKATNGDQGVSGGNSLASPRLRTQAKVTVLILVQVVTGSICQLPRELSSADHLAHLQPSEFLDPLRITKQAGNLFNLELIQPDLELD